MTSKSEVLNINVVVIITIIALHFGAELWLLLHKTLAQGILVVDEVWGLH